jgi:hypothetical protein
LTLAISIDQLLLSITLIRGVSLHWRGRHSPATTHTTTFFLENTVQDAWNKFHVQHEFETVEETTGADRWWWWTTGPTTQDGRRNSDCTRGDYGRLVGRDKTW